MRRAKTSTTTANFPSMAFTLCSSIISHNRDFINFSATPSSTNHAFQTTHFAFPFNQFNGQLQNVQFPARRLLHSKLTCTLAKKNNPFAESTNWCNTLTNKLNLLEHSVRRFDSAIAVIFIFLQLTCPVPLAGWASWPLYPAEAVLYSPETKIPRTGELALRRAIPANTDMKAIQDSLEDISYLLRIPQRKPYGTMEGNVKKALKCCRGLWCAQFADGWCACLRFYQSIFACILQISYIMKPSQEGIFRVVAAILHLGNVEFAKGKEIDSSVIKNEKYRFHLCATAELLRCDPKSLEYALIKHVMVTPEEVITRTLDPEAATGSRDALAKTVYSRLFD